MSFEYVYALIAGLIAKVLEKDTSCEEGQLDRLDMDICFVTMPSDCPYRVGYHESKDAIKVEKQEYNHNHDNDELEEEDPILQRLAKRC